MNLVIIIPCLLAILPSSAEVVSNSTQTPTTDTIRGGVLSHVYLLSNYLLDTISPVSGQYNESVIVEDLKTVHEIVTNNEAGTLEKVVGITEILLKIVGHHPGFSALFFLNLFLAFTLPVFGLIFCCCHLCGKCSDRSKTNQCETCGKVFWGSFLSVFLASLFITSVGALIANFYVRDGIENLPETLENVSENLDKYFNQTKHEFHTILVDNTERIENGTLGQIFDDLETSLIPKIKNLETNVQTSQNSLRNLLSKCKNQEVCSTFLDKEVGIEKFIAQDIAGLVDFSKELETFTKENKGENGRTSKLKEKFQHMNNQVQEKLSSIQSFLVDLTNTLSSATSSYQDYVHYIFTAGSVLVSMIFLLLVCYIIAVFLIMFGSSPTENDSIGCNETSGRKFLFTAIYFTFIFSTFLFLLASVSLTFSYWARLGVCRPLEDPQDTFLFNQLDQHIPYLNKNNLSSLEILQRCHQNMSMYSVIRGEKQNMDFGNIDQNNIVKEVQDQLVHYETMITAVDDGIFQMKEIQPHLKEISIDKEISELELVKKNVEEVKNAFEGLTGRENTNLIRQFQETLTKVGPCSSLSDNYNTTRAALCASIVQPVSAVWVAVQWSLLLCLLCMPVAVKLGSLSLFKEGYMEVFNDEVEMPTYRVKSNLAYRDSRMSSF